MIDDFDACILLQIGGWFDEWRSRYHIPAIWFGNTIVYK